MVDDSMVDERASSERVQPADKTFLGHSWHQLGYEVFVVVLGVAIALIGQQIVEEINWHYKVKATEAVMKAELGYDLALAQEHRLLNPCMTGFLNRLERAVVSADAASIRGLRDLKPPLPGRAWPRDTWSAALSNQVSDHMPDNRVIAYSRAFLRIGVQREFMQEMESIFPAALSGAVGVSADPSVVHSQVVAIEQLRSLEARRLMISNSLLTEDGLKLAITPSSQYLAEAKVAASACERELDE